MGLISCPDCRKEISSSAATCPGCGLVMANITRDFNQALTSEIDGTNEDDRRNTVWFRLTPKERKEIFSDDWSKYEGWNETGIGLTEKQQNLLEQIDLQKIQQKLIDDFGRHPTLVGRLAVRAGLPRRLQRLCDKQEKNNLKVGSPGFVSYNKKKSKKQAIKEENIKSDNKLSAVGIFYSVLIIIIIIICVSYFN